MMFSRMPVAPSIDSSSSGEEIAARAASANGSRRRPCRCPSSAEPASGMIVRTSAKSRLIRPGIVIRSVMPWTPWRRTLSASLKASSIEVRRSTTASSFSLGITISVSTTSRSVDAFARPGASAGALELERAGDDADGERADLLLGDLGDHGGGAGARAAALARGDEHHVGPLQGLLDVVARLRRRAEAHLGVRARAEALCGDVPMLSLRRRRTSRAPARRCSRR